MYLLTFCVRVITPPQYGRNGTAHAHSRRVDFIAGDGSQSSPACVVRGTACGVRLAWRITTGLCHAFP